MNSGTDSRHTTIALVLDDIGASNQCVAIATISFVREVYAVFLDTL